MDTLKMKSSKLVIEQARLHPIPSHVYTCPTCKVSNYLRKPGMPYTEIVTCSKCEQTYKKP